MYVMFLTDTCRNLSDSDLYGECRMENDNYRYIRQNCRKDHLCDQSVHDNFDLSAAHNRRYKGKNVFLVQ